MSEIIQLRGHIRSDANYLTYEWHKKGTRFFPKALVSNAENILRFLSLGYRANEVTPELINASIGKGENNQKPYLLQVSIDYNQHHFLYLALHPIKTQDGQLSELLRIHDLWVLFFGLLVYEENPLKALAENIRSTALPMKGQSDTHENSTETSHTGSSLASNATMNNGLSGTKREDLEFSRNDLPNGSSPSAESLPIASVSSRSESLNKEQSEPRSTSKLAHSSQDTPKTSSGANGLKNLIRSSDF